MPRLQTLPAFTEEEYKKAHRLLAAKVARMMGRTFEEADWTEVYCLAKNIPVADWSNLRPDIVHGRLMVEQKRLSRKASVPILTWCGTTLMHPAETRSIRVPDPKSTDPNEAMRQVFAQYAENLEATREVIAEEAGGEPDMRSGWLLYQPGTLREFLYFEQPKIAPRPKEYYAVWKEHPPKGARKGSVNLWIYDKATDQKRYSVTTEAGAKLQPYFDVPAPGDDNLYHFVVQGEPFGDDRIRIWLTPSTARELKGLLGGELKLEMVSNAILGAHPEEPIAEEEEVVEVLVSKNAYVQLIEKFEGVSDEHRVRLFVEYLRSES